MTAGSLAPAPPSAAPRLVTDDAARFWAAAAAGGDAEARARALEALYLRRASAPLRAWAPLRLAGPGVPAAEVERTAAAALARAMAERPRFYAAARAATLRMAGPGGAGEGVQAALRALAALHPGAVLPDVYLVVGRLMSAGSACGGAVVVAAEMFAGGPDTPVDELTEWERAVLGTADDLPGIAAHEAVHCLQPPLARRAPLLAHVLREGAADFVAGLAAPPTAAMRARHAWGDAHEGRLWDEIRPALHDGDPARWMYQGAAPADRPADLGYYVGYRICQAYYRRASDPAAAVHRILTHTDPQALLRDSGYAGREPAGLQAVRAP